MATRRVHLERLLGKTVRDAVGRRVGRIEEFRAEQQGHRCVVTEYLLGREGLMERLSISDLSLLLLRPLGARRNGRSFRVPWQHMDLSAPTHPRLRCTLAELEELQG